MKAALVLVDVQRDFLGDDRLHPAAGILVARVRELLDEFRRRALPVVHVRLLVEPDLSDAMPHWREAKAGQARCVVGTAGAEAPEGLEAIAGEPVVRKRFYGGFAGTDLGEVLEEAGADTLVIAGLYAHSCVRATLIEAYEYGYRVVIAREATGSNDAIHDEVTRLFFRRRGVAYLDHDEVRDLLAGKETIGSGARDPGREIGVAGAVTAAMEAQAKWARLDARERVAVLEGLVPLLEANADALADEIVRVVGKPLRFSRAEIDRCLAIVRAVIAATDDAPVDLGEKEADGILFRPVGVVAVITPWNHPLAIAVGKIVPALFYGNAVVWKPSPAAGLGPGSPAERLLELCRAAGLPEGVLQVLPGGRETGEALLEAEGIDAVTLTGGMAAGRTARAICAQRGLRLQAELGGNNATIVWQDRDRRTVSVAAAIAAAVAAGAFGYAGQRCTANRRVIVPRAGAEAFLAALVEATRLLRWGSPEGAETEIGPVISAESAARLTGIVERARADGLRVVTPLGERPKGIEDAEALARYFPPTIIYAAPPDHEIVRTETFGPVLVVQLADDWEEALRLCNGVEEGLVAALFSGDPERQDDFRRQAQAGVLKLNESTADVGVATPFGGWKASGIGPPEHGIANREFYTRTQAIYGGGD